VRRRAAAVTLLVMLGLLGVATIASAHPTKGDARLAQIGPAPEFSLAAAEGGRLALADLRGQVVAVTFIYTTCTDTCPLLTSKLVGVQRRLGRDAARVRFVGITVDPARDTPEALRRYALEREARSPAWAFLTGTPEEIGDVVRRYGVYARPGARGEVDHTFLTSVIDHAGVLRVQYMGVRFDPDEFLRDVRALLREAPRAAGRGGR
jgi:protein SCO1/2